MRHAEFNIRLPNREKACFWPSLEWGSFIKGTELVYDTKDAWHRRCHPRGFEALETITIRFLAKGTRRYTNPKAYANRSIDKKHEGFVHGQNMKILLEALAYYLPETTKLKTIKCWGRNYSNLNAQITNEVGISCLRSDEFDLDKISEVADRRVAVQMWLKKPPKPGELKRRGDHSLIIHSMSAWNWKNHERYMKYVSMGKGVDKTFDTSQVFWTTSEGQIQCTCHEKRGTTKIDHGLVNAWNKLKNHADWKEHGYVSYWTARHKLQSQFMRNWSEYLLKQCIASRDDQLKRERDPTWL